MKIIKVTDTKRLIPIAYFDICHEDGLTRKEISEKYKKEEVTPNKSCYFLQKFFHHLKQLGIDPKTYILKHLDQEWPICPISLKEVRLGRITGEGLIIPFFSVSVTPEFSPKFKEFCERMSEERKGAGNPMFGQYSWNKGLTKDTDDRLKEMGEKRQGAKMEEESKQKMRDARKKSEVKARHTTPHSEETKEVLRQNTARLWSEGVFNRVTSIHLKMREFLETLDLTSPVEEEFLAKYYALDFAFPDVKVGIECQGTFFHIDPRKYPNGPVTATQRRNAGRDKSKRKYLESKGWTVIEIWETEINNGEFKEYLKCKLKELNLLKV